MLGRARSSQAMMIPKPAMHKKLGKAVPPPPRETCSNLSRKGTAKELSLAAIQ